MMVRVCKRALLGTFLALFAQGFASFGAVPASVAVREQLPAVEQIIGQMEAKAAGAGGTWTTRSGRADAPAQAWSTGIDGKRWYWQSNAAVPHPAAGMILFNDGEDAYVLPYGQNELQGGGGGGGGGIRFQYDTLRRFQMGDYLLGHYLLHMNLQPRLFIGSLGGLSVAGEEELDGVKVVRLKSDPEADVVFKGDMAISHFYGAGKVSAMELYYDPQKRAIVKVVVGGSGRGGEGGHLELAVTGWDAESWPSKMTGRAVDVSGGKAGGGGKAVLTSVEKYQSGKDSALEGIARRVRDESFFVTPYEGLRNASFYKRAIAVQENASDRVALAQASFILCDIVEGVKQWDLVAAKLRGPRGGWERERLVRALGELSAGMLEQASEKKDQRQACVALIKRLNDETLSDEQFRKVSGGITPAWVRLREVEDTRVAIDAMNGTLLPKLARLGSVFTIETLMRLADTSKEDATLINPVFRQIMDMPVPTSGYSGSPQHYLFLAAIRQGMFERARSYLADLKWPEGGAESQRQIVALWQKTLPVVESVKGGNERSLEAAIGFYVEFSNEANAKDVRNSTYGKWLLTGAGQELLLKRMKEGGGGGAENLIVGTSKLVGSEAFWGSIVMTVAGGSVKDPNMLIQRVAPLLKVYGQTFNKPTFESEAWLRLAGSSEIRGKFLGVELSYLNKALVAAPDDAVRVKVILQIGNTYAAVKEYEKGTAAVGALADMVTDEKQRSQIDKLAAFLKARTTKG